MKWTRNTLVGIAAVSVVVSGTGVASAAPTPKYSDSQVIEFFATGYGAPASKRPDLAKALQARSKGPLTPAQVEALTAKFKQVDPNFHERVTVPAQAGDPERAGSAVAAYSEDAQKVSASTAQPRDVVWAQQNVWAQTQAVQQVVALSTLGIAVEAVAVVILIYRPAGGSTSYDQDVANANFAQALAA